MREQCVINFKKRDATHARDFDFATAAAHGVPREEVLKVVTLYPSQTPGIAGRVGSLDIGNDATLMITDGDPLELTTTVEQVYIRGKKSDMRDRQKQLYGKYQEKCRQMK